MADATRVVPNKNKKSYSDQEVVSLCSLNIISINIQKFEMFKNLKILWLNKNYLKNLSGLKYCTKLIELYAQQN